MAELAQVSSLAASRRSAGRGGYWTRAWRRYRHNQLASVGAAMVLALVLIALFGPLLLPYDPAVRQAAPYSSPSAQHWFGTDEIGRDVLTRIVYSLRTALLVAVGVELFDLVIGVTVGAVAGYWGGRVDNVLMRFTDLMYAFPGFLFTIVLVTVLGKGVLTIIVAVAATHWVGMARLVRGETLRIREQAFIEAARACGVRPLTLILRHILPHALGTIVVVVAFGFPSAMLIESGLSLLGLGVQPPAPSFGNLINKGLSQMIVRPYLLVFPAACLALVLAAFNFMADGLRDAFDPKVESQG